MAFRFFEWLKSKNEIVEVKVDDLAEAAKEYQIRQVCFWTCVNMVASAFGRCDFKTFKDGSEAKDREAYLWNVSPNRNQNSTAFLHELVAAVYKENEALIVSEPYGDGLVVAKHWDIDEDGPTNFYKNIDLGIKDRKIVRLEEKDVLHLKLYHRNMEKVIASMNDSYLRLVKTAMDNYVFNNGQHWKAEISRIAGGKDDDMQSSFNNVVYNQIKPFLESSSGVLPQFEGWKYSQVGGGADKKTDSTDIRNMIEDIFNFTARGFLIPAVLVNGKIEGTADANSRFMTFVVDPLADQLTEEVNRKRYSFEEWQSGTYFQVDTSAIMHFDMFANAANVEKLVGSGAFSVNELRRAAGMAPLKEAWANQHFLTLNISTMADAVSGNRNGKGVNKD